MTHMLGRWRMPAGHGAFAHCCWPAVAVLVDPAPTHWAEVVPARLPIVLVMPEELDSAAIGDAVLRGAASVVDFDSPPERLADAITMAARAGWSADHARAGGQTASVPAAGEAAGPIALTGRERDIVASIERGESVKQTATTLGITTKTVENLQSRLFRKLRVRNRAQAVSRCHGLGLAEAG